MVRRVVIRIGRTLEAGVERLDEALEPGQADVAVKAAIAHLLSPIEDVRGIAQPVRPAFEILLIVNVRIAGIGHHQIRDVEIFSERLEHDVAGSNELMIVVVGVNVNVAAVPVLAGQVRAAFEAEADFGGFSGADFNLPADDPVFDASHRLDRGGALGQAEQVLSAAVEIIVAVRPK